jgi:hypothetical protein
MLGTIDTIEIARAQSVAVCERIQTQTEIHVHIKCAIMIDHFLITLKTPKPLKQGIFKRHN